MSLASDRREAIRLLTDLDDYDLPPEDRRFVSRLARWVEVRGSGLFIGDQTLARLRRIENRQIRASLI